MHQFLGKFPKGTEHPLPALTLQVLVSVAFSGGGGGIFPRFSFLSPDCRHSIDREPGSITAMSRDPTRLTHLHESEHAVRAAMQKLILVYIKSSLFTTSYRNYHKKYIGPLFLYTFYEILTTSRHTQALNQSSPPAFASQGAYTASTSAASCVLKQLPTPEWSYHHAPQVVTVPHA